MRVVAWIASLLAASCSASRPAPRASSAALSLACDDRAESVYQTPPLAAATPERRGVILRCARAETHAGASVLRVAYQTERLAGQAGASSALVFLPSVPRRLPMPWVVFAHGTAGLADRCAPSRDGRFFVDPIALPLARLGVAVIATDYAGLGNSDGRAVQGYGVAEDQAHSVLDAARALRALLPAGALEPSGVLVGHSQGGGAVMAAQSMARSYGAGVGVAGVIALAPGWYDARIVGRFITREASTHGPMELPNAFAATWLYAHHAVYEGADAAAAPFAAPARDGVRRAMRERCIVTLGERLSRLAPTLEALYDPVFRDSVRVCLEGGACAEPGRSWMTRADADRPSLDANGPPVRIVQGLRDALITPAVTRCALDRVAREGVDVRACTLPDADHLTVLGDSVTFVAEYLDARSGRGAEPACRDALPRCETP